MLVRGHRHRANTDTAAPHAPRMAGRSPCCTGAGKTPFPRCWLYPTSHIRPFGKFHSSVNRNEGAAQSSGQAIKIRQSPVSKAGHTFPDGKTQRCSRERQHGKLCARTSRQSWEPLSSTGRRKRRMMMMMMSLLEVQARVCSPVPPEHVQCSP